MNKIIVLILALSLAACAQGARPEAMVSRPAGAVPNLGTLTGSISVGQVSGGQATSPLWTSQVDNVSFAAALRESLAAYSLVDIAGNRFRVDAVLINLGQPLAGFDMTVTAVVSYRVTHAPTGRTVFERPIATPFTANFSSALMGVERLRLGNEGAVRENIAAFIAALVEAERVDPGLLGVRPTA